ncbi:MAG: sulfatase-like hydrolase/transferase [Phycisphaerales bacterium JB063]
MWRWLFCAAGVWLSVLAAWPVLALDNRPNILVIVTDDQAPFTLSCYGNTICRTPNLDALVERGVVIDRAYHMGSWSGAVCTPSRHMIMTGRTVWHIPGNSNPNHGDAGWVPAGLADQSMAAVFNRAGYVTFRTCKRGNSYEAANAQFTHRHDLTRRGGTAETGSAWHADRAVEFLHRMADRDEQRPLLMYLGFSHPHDVRNGLPDLLDHYGAYNADDPPSEVNPDAPPLPSNYLPAHPFPHGHPNLRDEVAVQGVMRSRSEATIRNEMGREYACIENIDTQIGRVLRQLEAMGELENTYIIFTADHGIAVGRHGLAGKQNLYEHTWRVPMIVAGPDIPHAGRATGNVYLLDILATICDFAGIDPPDTNEGVSFGPVVRGEVETVRDVLYGVYCGGTKPGMRSVRLGDWKLIKYDVLDGEVRQTQLFNLADNPDELLIEHHAPAVVALTGHTPAAHQVNLADDPRYAAKRAELEQLLQAEMDRLDDPFRLWDQPTQ